jgi:pyrroline-5-carboxylate reductase
MTATFRYGFVGAGAIAKAIICGLLKEPSQTTRIIVSPRNAELSAELAARFPEVTVAPDNQSVVDQADVVFLAVRPQVAAEVIPPLRFHQGQLVISLIAATGREQLQDWIPSGADIVQAIPLPFVESREGVTAIFPPNPEVAAIFDLLGTALSCESKEEYDLLATASATMSLYFGFMGRIVEWLRSNGMPEHGARAYMAGHFDSLSKVALRQPEAPLPMLAEEYATKGGLNEQVWLDFDQRGGTSALVAALDRVHRRIKGAD